MTIAIIAAITGLIVAVTAFLAEMRRWIRARRATPESLKCQLPSYVEQFSTTAGQHRSLSRLGEDLRRTLPKVARSDGSVRDRPRRIATDADPRRASLCANDDETKHWAKFRLRGSQENVSWSCRIKPWRRRVRWVPAQKEAGGRLSCRHPSQPTLKFLTAPAGGHLPRRRSYAFSKRPTKPPAPAKSVRSCAVMGSYSSALGE